MTNQSQNNKKLKPVRNCRESLSFLDSSNLDATNPNKLVQLIQENFPIEIESVPMNSRKSNENNVNQQNSVEPDQVDIHDSKNRRSHSRSACRDAEKHLSKSVRRRTFIKAFENQLMGSNFQPEATSTPKPQANRFHDFGPIVPNVPCDKAKDTTINETLRPNTPSLPPASGPSFSMPTEPSSGNATTHQEKSMFDAVMRKNSELQLTEKTLIGYQTQILHESIDIDDSGFDKDPQKTVADKQNNTTKSTDQQMDETIINSGDVLQSQLETNHSNESSSSRTPLPLSRSKSRAELSQRSMFSTHHFSQIVRERSLEPNQIDPQSSETITSSASSTPKPLWGEVFGTIIEGINQSITFASAALKQQRQNLGQRIHDASLTIPPTQSQPTPAGPSQNPLVVSPISTTCDKNHQGDPVEIPQPSAQRDKSQLERINETSSSVSSPIVITSYNTIESANISSYRGTRKASTSRPIDKQSSAQKSTLVEMDEVQEIENFLKNVNQSYSVAPTEKQTTSRATSTSSRVENDPMEPLIYNSSSSSREDSLFDFDESIIQPLNGLPAKKHSFICDMSPQSGAKWIDPFIQNITNSGKNSTMVKRAKQVVVRNMEPPQVNYKDVLSAMEQSSKHKPIAQSRQKLYSKGVSDNEDSSEQSSEKHNESTQYDISSIKLVTTEKKANQNFVQSQLSTHRVHTKIKTIGYRLTNSEMDQSDSNSRKKSALVGDEHLFKIPHVPPTKSNKFIAPEQCLPQNSIPSTSKGQLESTDQSSSSSATENSYNSNHSTARHTKRSRKGVEQHPTEAVDLLYRKIPQAQTLKSKKRKLSSNFEPPETRSKTRQLKKSKNEVPGGNKVATIIESEKSVVEQNNKLDSRNCNIAEVDMNTKVAGQSSISVHYTRKVQANEEIAITEKSSTSKKSDPSEKKANNEKNTKKPTPTKKENAGENETVPKGQESVTSEAEGTTSEAERTTSEAERTTSETKGTTGEAEGATSAKSSTSDTNSNDVDTTSSLRRSIRARRAPIAYWTSKREMDAKDVCYISSTIGKKRAKKKKLNASTKPPKQIEQIFDSIVSSKDLTDYLFDTLKETPMNKRPPLPETIPEVDESTTDRNSIEQSTRSSVVPSTSKRNRIQSTATK